MRTVPSSPATIWKAMRGSMSRPHSCVGYRCTFGSMCPYKSKQHNKCCNYSSTRVYTGARLCILAVGAIPITPPA